MPYSDKFDQESYKKNLVLAAVNELSDEDIVYAVFAEFVMFHKTPSERFILAPQLNLSWKPGHSKDRRKEVPDFGIGHFTLPGHWQPGERPSFKLRCGVEAKRHIKEMEGLPTPDSLINDTRFASLRFGHITFVRSCRLEKCHIEKNESITVYRHCKGYRALR